MPDFSAWHSELYPPVPNSEALLPPSKLVLEKSTLSWLQSSAPPSTLSIHKALPLSSLLETGPTGSPTCHTTGKVGAWFAWNCHFFHFVISFLGVLIWSQWAFIGKIVKLCNLYTILLSSISFGSIQPPKPCMRAQAITDEIQICHGC